MIRRYMKTLLCLLLVLAMPLCALADTQHTLSIVPGDEIAADPMVKDIFDALSFKLTTGENGGALTLAISEADIVSIAAKADEQGMYLQSEILGKDVYYVSWDAAFAFLEDAIRSSATVNGETPDAEALAMIGPMLEQYKTQLTTALATGSLAGNNQAKTPEEAMAMVEEMFKDDPGMITYTKNILSRTVAEDGNFTDAERDAATRKYALTMDENDLMAVCDTKYMRTMIESAVKAEAEEPLTDEQLAAKVDETIDEVKKLYASSDMDMTMTAYTTDEDNTLVGMEMGMTMTEPREADDDEDELETVAMNMNYDRLTADNDEVSHKATMSMTLDNQPMMEMTFDLAQNHQTGVSEGMLAIWADDTQVTVLYNGENTQDGRQRSLALYSRNNATTIVAPAAAERPVLTFVLTTTQVDNSLLAAVEAATADSSTDLIKSITEDGEAFAAALQTNMMQVLMSGMSHLPASVLQSMQQAQ